MLHTAAHLRRLSFLFRLFALLPDTRGEKPKAIWGGVVLLEAQRTLTAACQSGITRG
jgi:hypothetical protein